MIHPESKTKAYWDLFVLIITIFAAIIVPLTVVFSQFFVRLSVFASFLIYATFITDIILRFYTAFSRQGKIISDKKLVAQQYLTHWFSIDLIAALPIGLILSISSLPNDSIVQLLRILVLLKLFRIGNTLQRIGGTNINPAILRLFLLVFWILVAAHIIACGWILLSGIERGMTPVTRYIRAFYWTITTLTTIGYGDITPTTNIQTLYVIFIEILGAGMYGLVIGNIANLIANIDIAKTQFKEKLDKVNTFLKYRNIPQDMQKKINNYYNYLWDSRRGYDESSVLDDLPVSLKESVAIYLNKEIIEKVPIFEGASDELIKDIIMNMTPVVFTPGDDIVRAGEVGFDMYFISKGSVDVLSADGQTKYATLSDGQFFGEIALLLSTPRTATIRAREYCDLYRLDKETFDRILTRYPGFKETIEDLAEKRKKETESVKNKKK
jgi:voltage-gated potassium channel